MIEKIIVHGGHAHLDEVVACALVMARKGPAIARDNICKDLELNNGIVPIERRDPRASDLADPHTVVLDTGLSYASAFSNFDHHQYGPDNHASAMCLLARHIRIYRNISKGATTAETPTFDAFMPVIFHWWMTASEVDCIGPFKTAKNRDLQYEKISPFIGPLAGIYLRMFENSPSPEARGMFVYETLTKFIDRKIEAYFLTADELKVDTVGSIHVLDFTSAPPDACEEASGALLVGHKDGVALFHTKPRVEGETYKTTGLTLLRLRDDERIDFTKVQSDPEVTFVHKSGFLCTTRTKDMATAKRLVRDSIR